MDTVNGLAVHGKFKIELNEWLIRNCSLMSMPAKVNKRSENESEKRGGSLITSLNIFKTVCWR